MLAMTRAAAKVLIFDLSGVGQVWRVVSTVGVGLLMIGAAMVYARVSERIENEPKDPSPEGPAAPTHPMS